MDVEKEIRSITDQINELHLADRTSVIELLEHNEWGVALEHLCAAITEERILISKKLYLQIEAIAKEMDMGNDIYAQLKDCLLN